MPPPLLYFGHLGQCLLLLLAGLMGCDKRATLFANTDGNKQETHIFVLLYFKRVCSNSNLKEGRSGFEGGLLLLLFIAVYPNSSWNWSQDTLVTHLKDKLATRILHLFCQLHCLFLGWFFLRDTNTESAHCLCAKFIPLLWCWCSKSKDGWMDGWMEKITIFIQCCWSKQS